MAAFVDSETDTLSKAEEARRDALVKTLKTYIDPKKTTGILKFTQHRPHKRKLWLSADGFKLEWKKSFFKKTESVVHMNDILRIQQGLYTPTFEKLYDEFEKKKELAFSIIYKGYKSIDLLAEDEEDFDCWYTGLQHALDNYRQRQIEDANRLWLDERFSMADCNRKNNALDKDEFYRLLRSVNLSYSTHNAHALWEKLDVDNSRTLTMNEVEVFLRNRLLVPNAILPIWKKAAHVSMKTVSLDMKNFKLFLHNEQKQKESNMGVYHLMQQSHIGEDEIKEMRYKDFCNYICSAANDIFDPQKLDIHHDMTQVRVTLTFSSSLTI